jgi:hypothetical protein
VKEIEACVTARRELTESRWPPVKTPAGLGRWRHVRVIPPRRYPLHTAHESGRRRHESTHGEVADGEISALAV